MKRLLQKPYRWAMVFSAILACSIVLILLDTFVIQRTGIPEIAVKAATTAATAAAAGTLVTGTTAANKSASGSTARTETVQAITGNTYQDANIRIAIETVRKYNTNIYIADIQIASLEYLQTAFAKDTYGRNIREATSSIAESHNAILAINGDYYGFRNYGFVLRNGILYRSVTSKSGTGEALAIDSLGNFSVIQESQTDAQSLVAAKVWQVLSFGPVLVNEGKITVTANSEVGQSMASNPRTAIGQVSALHYICIVSDGRTSASAGLSLLQLAQEFRDRGCTTAYNLDGGGSSTLWFNGQVINSPTDGRSSSERSVSDIVYFGY